MLEALGIELDFYGPHAPVCIAGHFFSVLIGNEFLQVLRASVRAAIIHPPDAPAFFAGVGSETNRYFQHILGDFCFHLGRGQEWLGDFIREKMAKEECGFVLLIAFDFGCPFLP